MTQTHPISNIIGNKGHLFEDTILEKLDKNSFNLWECKKELHHTDKTSKEIDISFCYKNILFIAELKSIVRSFASEAGTIKALEFRRKKLEEALRESEDKADWLKNHKKGTNYEIPKGIDLIVPFVISPFPEYIWSINEKYWLTKEIPRICLASELKSLLKDEVYSEIINKSYVRFLN